jgi:hypothetical protein
MKLFAIAFSITCVIAAVLFAIALAVLLPFVEHSEAMKAAAALGGAPILTFPKIAEFLEQERSRKNLVAGQRTPVYDFRGFQIAWPLMVLYGVLLLAAIDAISSVVGGMLAAGVMISQDRQEDAITAMYVGLVMATPFMIVGAYLVGRWIGTRCSRRGVMVVLLVVLAYSLLNNHIYYLQAMMTTSRDSPGKLLSFGLLSVRAFQFWFCSLATGAVARRDCQNTSIIC